MWPDEARDITPWLLENVDVLNSLLGMEMVFDVAEHPVGGFSLPREGVKSTRIANYSPEQCDVGERKKWAEWVDWLIDNRIRLRAAVATIGGVPLPNGAID